MSYPSPGRSRRSGGDLRGSQSVPRWGSWELPRWRVDGSRWSSDHSEVLARLRVPTSYTGCCDGNKWIARSACYFMPNRRSARPNVGQIAPFRFETNSASLQGLPAPDRAYTRRCHYGRSPCRHADRSAAAAVSGAAVAAAGGGARRRTEGRAPVAAPAPRSDRLESCCPRDTTARVRIAVSGLVCGGAGVAHCAAWHRWRCDYSSKLT
jgi:hypothetical protein